MEVHRSHIILGKSYIRYSGQRSYLLDELTLAVAPLDAAGEAMTVAAFAPAPFGGT